MDALRESLSPTMIALLALGGLLLAPRDLRVLILGIISLGLLLLAVGNLQVVATLAALAGLIYMVLRHSTVLLVAGLLALVALAMPSWLRSTFAVVALIGLATLRWHGRD
jgi:ascorbate-specific PTS system EIIC-type component UlaA